MPADDRLQERRSDYDVTNSVQVSSPNAVRAAVAELFGDLYPHNSFDAVWLGFYDFERLFNGSHPDYYGVDTTYHDIQHTLDMTLAMVRLLSGYERSAEPADRLGPDRAMLGLVTALFHDAGYLRHRRDDRDKKSGAEFTLSHVTRSARFLGEYLPTIGMSDAAERAKQIVHFTGYEISLDRLELDDPRDSILGHLLGTADLVAQMSDRCYLEKCRDRLFPEFVLGGIAVEDFNGEAWVRYRSGRDLLAQTLKFYQVSARRRLEHNFNRAYRYMEVLCDGENPYIAFIQKNLAHLGRVLKSGDWTLLRRKPACVTPYADADTRITSLAVKHLKGLAREDKIRLRRGGSELSPLPALI